MSPPRRDRELVVTADQLPLFVRLGHRTYVLIRTVNGRLILKGREAPAQ